MGGGEVLKKGWLVKSPPLESGGMKSWRKRYFLLRSSKILEYYKSETGDIKGVVNLEDCVSVHSDLFHKKYKHVFDIQTRDRTYYLVAPSLEDMTSWVTALCSLCDFTTQESTTRSPRSASTLPMSVVKTPLPPEPSARFSPEMQKYLLSPEVVDLLRNIPPENNTVPAGLPLQEALVQKGLTSHTHSHTFSYPNSARTSTASSIESFGLSSQHSSQDLSIRYSGEGVDYTSHYDVPPRSNRAQLLSNNYMVPRLARDPLHNYDILPPTRPTIPDGGHTHYDYLPKRDIPLPPRCGDVGGASIYDVPPPPRPLIDTHIPTIDTPTLDILTIDTPTSRSHSIDSTDCPPLLPPPQVIFRRDSKNSDSEMIPNKMYDMVWAGQDEFSLLPSPPHELEETLTDKSHRPYVNLCVDEIPPPVNRTLKPSMAPPTIDRTSKPTDRRTSMEDTFHPRELPRLTSHSVHYTQVSFDRKKPVPTPRTTNRTPTASPQRVNYCHIDITATNAPTLASPKEPIDSNSL